MAYSKPIYRMRKAGRRKKVSPRQAASNARRNQDRRDPVRAIQARRKEIRDLREPARGSRLPARRKS